VEIENAARSVKLQDVIAKLPGGFDANVGEGGVRLSAGQRQRLALARVFLQDPEVIILDEATSSLDTDSETAIAQAMGQWLGKRTMIIVAHKLDPSWPVTRVVKMEAGRIVAP
jgi:ABC-type bacteriocin/lantibiotic exporter with double-glycine peptidase domain